MPCSGDSALHEVNTNLKKINKYRKFKNPNHPFLITLVLYIICDKCCSNDEKIYKEKEPSEILKILGLIKNMEKYHINI